MNPIGTMAANMGMGNMHSSMMGNMPSNMGPKMSMQQTGPVGATNSMYPRRMAPYPSPAIHMSQKRTVGQSYPTPGPSPNMNPQFNPNGQYPGYATRQPSFQNQYPTQQALGPTGNFGPGKYTLPICIQNPLLYLLSKYARGLVISS